MHTGDSVAHLEIGIRLEHQFPFLALRFRSLCCFFAAQCAFVAFNLAGRCLAGDLGVHACTHATGDRAAIHGSVGSYAFTFGVAFFGLDAGDFFGVTCAEGFLGLGACMTERWLIPQCTMLRPHCHPHRSGTGNALRTLSSIFFSAGSAYQAVAVQTLKKTNSAQQKSTFTDGKPTCSSIDELHTAFRLLSTCRCAEEGSYVLQHAACWHLCMMSV